MTNKEDLRFGRLVSCDVEARVRRLKWAQTLVQNLARHVQLIGALFGRLLAKQHPTLGLDGEVTLEAHPWAARWMVDLWELEPYDDSTYAQ